MTTEPHNEPLTTARRREAIVLTCGDPLFLHQVDRIPEVRLRAQDWILDGQMSLLLGVWHEGGYFCQVECGSDVQMDACNWQEQIAHVVRPTRVDALLGAVLKVAKWKEEHPL